MRPVGCQPTAPNVATYSPKAGPPTTIRPIGCQNLQPQTGPTNHHKTRRLATYSLKADPATYI